MSHTKHKKKSEMLLENLKKRSKEGLEFARRTILAEKIECEEIREALEYYTSNWKNFIHPGLFSIACEAVGGNPDRAVPIQAALSMIAAAFDIHDDIIDKSKVKHGKSTVFGKFGKDIALLSGNAFIVKGFTLFSESIGQIPRGKMKEIFETLEKSLFELGNAHALELNLKRRIDITPEEYMQILEMKAVSVEADMRIGAIIGGGTNSEIEALAKYGRIVGILATLRDEFVDVFELEELCQRMKNEYLPIPLLYAFQNAIAKEKIQNILLQKQMTKEHVEEIVDIVLQAEETEKLKSYMKTLMDKAFRHVASIRRSPAKVSLENLAIAMLEDL
jgi:geranylgeranyl pyrophosphate synthase